MQQTNKEELVNDQARIFAISDIHGHLKELLYLLRAARYRTGEDRLYLLGDYIDTAPASWAVLPAVEHLCRRGARAIIGNKEVEWLNAQHKLTVKHPAYAFIRRLPVYLTEGKNYLFVHAGVRPGVALAQQTVRDCTTIREPFLTADLSCKCTIVFGHTPTVRLGAAPGKIWLKRGKIGIDTGAKHNLRLTLVDLTNRLAYSASTAPTAKPDNLHVDHW